MIEGTVFWLAGIIVGAAAKNYLPKWFSVVMVKFRKDAKAKAAELLKDPDWKQIVTLVIAKVQKEAGSESSKRKLRLASEYIKTLIPTNLDDMIIDAMIELIITEIKIPIEI
jgi:hypothetical protein